MVLLIVFIVIFLFFSASPEDYKAEIQSANKTSFIVSLAEGAPYTLFWSLFHSDFHFFFINHFSSDFLFGWQMGHRVFSFDFLFCLSLTFHLSFILNFFLNFIVGLAEGPRPIYFFASNNLSTSRRAKAKSLQSGNQYVSKFEHDWPKYKQLYTCIIFIIERTWLKKVQLRPDHIIKILGTSSLPRYSWLFSKCFQ